MAQTAPRDLDGLTASFQAISDKLDLLASRQDSGAAARTDRDAAIAEVRADIAGLARAIGSNGPNRMEGVERRLESLADRVEALHQASASGTGMRAIERRLTDVAQALAGATAAGGTAAIAQDIKTMSVKLDKLGAQHLGQGLESTGVGTAAALAELRADVAKLTQAISAHGGIEPIGRRLDDLASRLDGLRMAGADSVPLQGLEDQLHEIVRGLEEIGHHDLSGLTEKLAAISLKLDQFAARGIDASAVSRLQRQVDEIRTIVEQSARADSFDRPLEALARRIDTVANRIDALGDALARSSVPAALEGMVRALMERVEAAESNASARRYPSVSAMLTSAISPMVQAPLSRAVPVVTSIIPRQVRQMNLNNLMLRGRLYFDGRRWGHRQTFFDRFGQKSHVWFNKDVFV